VRNPFGFWDDYSIFRNLSAIKTDPISLGVALRRTDLGVLFFGNVGGFRYDVGILQGSNTFSNRDLNDLKDVVGRVGKTFGPIDIAANLYLHNPTETEPTNAQGISFRYRASRNFTLLGEYVSIDNQEIEVSTIGFYLQSNLNLSDYVKDGLRWNLFFEVYDSDLLTLDLDPALSYRFAGTFFQGSTGLVYAYNRKIDIGMKLLGGLTRRETNSSSWPQRLTPDSEPQPKRLQINTNNNSLSHSMGEGQVPASPGVGEGLERVCLSNFH